MLFRSLILKKGVTPPKPSLLAESKPTLRRKCSESRRAALLKIGDMIEIDEEPPGLLTAQGDEEGRQLPRGSRNLAGGRDALYGQ